VKIVRSDRIIIQEGAKVGPIQMIRDSSVDTLVGKRSDNVCLAEERASGEKDSCCQQESSRYRHPL